MPTATSLSLFGATAASPFPPPALLKASRRWGCSLPSSSTVHHPGGGRRASLEAPTRASHQPLSSEDASDDSGSADSLVRAARVLKTLPTEDMAMETPPMDRASRFFGVGDAGSTGDSASSPEALALAASVLQAADREGRELRMQPEPLLRSRKQRKEHPEFCAQSTLDEELAECFQLELPRKQQRQQE